MFMKSKKLQKIFEIKLKLWFN